ncbi:hypothetical protein CLV84_2964 [Neolewinella xylanilytica]|uniref:Uncharacterized protein n=1 Tax=Neolewinella xylanilytica TaxID=1514080 RepID=A0A2S6I4D8_9BACT|nr:hypothetical protein CLV84_2964 [Neolewinella xylanilytica]
MSFLLSLAMILLGLSFFALLTRSIGWFDQL